mmetsp:Transcript_34005/g.73343  ORF Transcript_34005/g.73343 Transcript_34005/m.73343 type:complete len:331 (+) Transcript_34005:2-994(+)
MDRLFQQDKGNIQFAIDVLSDVSWDASWTSPMTEKLGVVNRLIEISRSPLADCLEAEPVVIILAEIDLEPPHREFARHILSTSLEPSSRIVRLVERMPETFVSDAAPYLARLVTEDNLHIISSYILEIDEIASENTVWKASASELLAALAQVICDVNLYVTVTEAALKREITTLHELPEPDQESSDGETDEEPPEVVMWTRGVHCLLSHTPSEQRGRYLDAVTNLAENWVSESGGSRNSTSVGVLLVSLAMCITSAPGVAALVPGYLTLLTLHTRRYGDLPDEQWQLVADAMAKLTGGDLGPVVRDIWGPILDWARLDQVSTGPLVKAAR